MKKTLFSLFFFLSIFFVANSQVKYGDVTIDELKMQNYSQDSTANAVILSKVGETNFKFTPGSGFQFEYTLKMRIKILTKEGLDHATQSISYTDIRLASREEIVGLTGITYNLEDGKIVKTKLSKDLIFDEDFNDTYKLKKFTMPAVKVGSVIEFKYTLVSDFFASLPTFTFQDYVPTLYTSYDVIIPEYFKYVVDSKGYNSVSGSRKLGNTAFLLGGDMVRCSSDELSFVAHDVPALKNEPYLWSLADYMSRVTFELQSIKFPGGMLKSYTNTWENVDEKLLSYTTFGDNLKKNRMV